MPKSSPPVVLVTGFEAFGDDALNPSWEVARALDGAHVAGAVVRAVQLPCVFGQALARLDEALDAAQRQGRLQLVVALGLAGGRAEWTPERIAINCDDARMADNAGGQPIDVAVVPAGPAAYFSTLPIKAMVQALHAAALPGAVSNTAGTFVCNHVFYGLMHRLATQPLLAGVRGGFIHVPWLPEQVVLRPGMPSMALQTQVQALRVVLEAALRHAQDVRVSGGRLH